MRATASLRIDRSADEVFSYVTDVSRMPEWVSGVRDARLVSDRMGLGAKYVVVYTGMTRRPAEMEVEVTDFERPRLFGSRTTRGPFEFEGRIEVVDDGDATVVTSTARATDDLATRVVWTLLGWLITKPWMARVGTELENLAAAMDRNSTTL